MMIKLYHGSNARVEKPDLHKSKPYKDFGQGFYLSDDKQQAWDIAYSKVAQFKTGKAMVSTFLFDDSVILSIEKLIEELKYAKGITFQYYFGTENALNKLCYDTTE